MGSGAITYDAENRIRTAGGVTYTYDGDGKRVEKSNGTLYWTGVGSDALSESDLSGNINEEYVLFNGMRVSRIDRPSGNNHALLLDPLNSARMMVTPLSATTLKTEEDLDYSPYGIVVTGNAADHYEFTGKERDAESGLDMFGARYYGSGLGRFMTPDWATKPVDVPYAIFGDPQSLNLYVYVQNNPLSHADVDGHCDKNGLLCQAWTWLTSNHSASGSASATAAQSSAANGPLSATEKMGTAQASASASYGTNTSVSLKASATFASTTINEGSHSTTQIDSHTVTADAHAGISLGGDKGLSAGAGAGAGAYVLSASQTETATIGPVTITGTASGNVGAGASASASVGTTGVSASAGVTLGYGGSLSLSIGWNGTTALGGASVKGTMDKITTSIDKPKVE